MADELRSEKREVKSEKPSLLTFYFLLLTFLILCLVNNVALPIFEAPDEASHFIFVDYLARERRLPDLNAELPSAHMPSHESAQPPLYYALAALVVSPFDRSNLGQFTQLNPDWFDKTLNPNFVSVRNQHTHSDSAVENFPYQSSVWAVHAARLFSSLLGAATIVLVYWIARSVFIDSQLPPQVIVPLGGRSAIANLCAVLVAFNPKFIHLSSVVSNDIAIVLTCTLACWWMVRMQNAVPDSASRSGKRNGDRGKLRIENEKNGHSQFSILPFHFAPGTFRNSQFFVLGALIGAAVLCKLQGLGLFVPALVAVFLIKPRKSILKRLIGLIVGFALVAGWWLVLNAIQYGNPLALDQVAKANASMLRTPPLNLGEIIATIPLWFTTYWGSVGVELTYPDWLNAIFFAGLILAVIGCAIAFATGLRLITNRAGLWLLLLAEVALVVLYVLWLRIYVGTENSRLVMANLAPTVILVVLGWLTLAPRRSWRMLTTTVTVALLVLSIATPFTTIQPAFATPNVMNREQIIAAYKLPNAGVATFDGSIQLLHAELDQKRVKPGESVGVTLYWGALQPMNQSYRVILEALDTNDELIGRKQFIPFNGRFATQRWPHGDQFFRDEYALPIDATAPRGPARIQLSLWHQYPSPGLMPIDGADADKFLIGRVKVDASNIAPSAVQSQAIATFGQMIRLDHVKVQPNIVTFDWTALKQPDKDYTLFMHVLDGAGNRVAQTDGQPFDGQYPTGLWDANERVRDVRQMALPTGAKRLRIGWYDSTGQRLTAQQSDGSRWQDDIVLIDIP